MTTLPSFSFATLRRVTSLALNVGFALIAMSSAASAQTTRPGLISQAVNESQRIQLRGNVNPAATRSADRGIVPASMAADRMILLLKRSPEQERALRADIEAMHNSKSPSFHKWLTPQQFGAKWGAADSDIAAVTAWLQSHGFTVQGPSTGRTTIEFSGTAGQLQGAFHTEIHSYMVNGELHHANATDPQIPAALAPVVAGVTAMDDFRPKSSARSGKRVIYNTETRKTRPALTESGNSGNFFLVGPSDAATIYNSPNKALNPAATGTTYDGTGAKIGIINDSNISLAQDANYRKIFGLTAKAPTVILAGVDPGENGDALEAYLDVELAGGIAPGATVYLYTSADSALNSGLDLSIIRAVNDNLADILNLSFTVCEGAIGQVRNEFYESLWEQAAGQGMSVTVATGDSGSANCDDPNTQTEATGGLQVNAFASTAYNIAVGGTDFAALLGPDGSGSDFTKYVSLGSDPTTLRTALGYIPEVAWNDSSSTFPPGAISTNAPWAAPYANIAGTGGGKSQCVVAHLDQNGNLICESGYPKPSWQSAPGVPADSARDIPDVSLFSADGFDLAAWGICTDLQVDNNNNPVSDCTPGSDGLPSNEFYITGVGGTSAAAPAFAGVLALVKQATGERQGQASYVLYNLARTAPAVFHDINPGTTIPGGNNAVPCTAGSPGCVKNASGYYYMSANETTTGYDLATGLGSVDVSALVSNWSSAALTTSTTTLTITPTSFQHGTVATVTANVTSPEGVPTGQVAISAEANPPSLPLSQAIGVYPLDATGSTGPILINSIPGGNYKAIASYSGSEILTGSVSAPVQMSVTPEPSIIIIGASVFDPITGASPAGFTFPYGDYIGYTAQIYGKNSPIINGQVVPDGVPTGNVTFKANSVVLDADPIGINGVAESINHNLSPATYVITGQYPGDNSFLPNSSSQAMTITKGVTQITLKASATKYTGTPLVFTVALTTRSIAAAPTGTVSLIAKTAAGSTTIASAPLVGVAASGQDLSSGTATISTSNLPTENSEIVAVYQGDQNYASSTSNTVAVSARPTFTITGTSVTLPNENSSAAATLIVTSLNSYAGTINYTCAMVSGSTTSKPPLCSMNPASSTLTAGSQTEPVMLIYGQGSKLPTPTKTSSNRPPLGLSLGAGATVLACCVFFGIPARRRKWQSMLSAILMLAALGSLSACVSQPKLISTGSYTFKVTGVDSKDTTNTASATVQVTVK